MNSPSIHSYSFGFTAGSLGVGYCQKLAQMREELGSWDDVRKQGLGMNALQQGKKSSSERVEREFRQRVETLSDRQLGLLAHGNSDVARPMALLAAFKRYPVIFDFCVITLKPKLALFDTEVRPSDIERFFTDLEPAHPEIEKLTDSTKAKIRQVLLRILVEAGILSGSAPLVIAPLPLVPEAALAIAEESPSLLKGFLVEDAEIASYAQS
ncbi:DUF1819 family protein [Haloferula sp.]|uniref:DUF1819 family protein n=1 Tax=Haloferula sp. TaxID=2497595 RepID=UPI00329D5334